MRCLLRFLDHMRCLMRFLDTHKLKKGPKWMSIIVWALSIFDCLNIDKSIKTTGLREPVKNVLADFAR